MKLKSQVDLLKVRVARENVLNAEILHDDHAREIDE